MQAERSRLDWKRLGFIGDGVFFLVLAAIFGFQTDLGRVLWKWQDESLTAAFLAALLASYGAGSLLLARLGDWRAAIGGTLALIVALTGFAATVGVEELLGARRGLAMHAMTLAVIAALGIGTLIASLRSDARDSTPIPLPLRIALMLMSLVILSTGLALLAGVRDVLPWITGPRTSLLIGWLFTGFACNFAYVAWRGKRPAARVLLFGLLVYDVVLIVPLLRAFASVSPEHEASLIGNAGAAVVTAAIALYYLLADRSTRVGAS